MFLLLTLGLLCLASCGSARSYILFDNILKSLSILFDLTAYLERWQLLYFVDVHSSIIVANKSYGGT